MESTIVEPKSTLSKTEPDIKTLKNEETNKCEYMNTDIFNPKLLFTQLGIALYRNNDCFENIDIRRISHHDQSSLFVHVSTNTKNLQSIETIEFREYLQNIKKLIFQDERLVAATLRKRCIQSTKLEYLMYEYPVGEELILFNTTLAQETISSKSSDNDNSISLEYFDEPDEDEWDMCTKQELHLNREQPRYWCIFPSNSNKDSTEYENVVNTLFYSVLDDYDIKRVLNRDITLCYRVIFQHPILHKGIVRSKIHIMEVNRIEKEN